MAQLYPVKTLIQFGGSAGASAGGIAKFGSLKAGTPVFSLDPAVIQALAAWVNGWTQAVITGNNAPPLEDMNAAFFVLSYMLSNLQQEGIREWDTGVTYNKGSIVKVPYASTSGARMYVSLIDANTANTLPTPPASDSNWQYCGDLTLLQTIFNYRKPNLVWVDATHVTVEVGLDGNGAGRAIMQFHDGQLLQISTAAYISLDMTRVASFGGSPQSGLDTGAVAANTWYHIYAVKANSNAVFVLAASLLEPIQTNFATLNSRFGTNGWEYLGTVRCGDNLSATTGILQFVQSGPVTQLMSYIPAASAKCGDNIPGIDMANTTGATSITYSYAAGGGATQIPSFIDQVFWHWSAGSSGTSGAIDLIYPTNAIQLDQRYYTGFGGHGLLGPLPAAQGLRVQTPNSASGDLCIIGWVNKLLAGGSYPVL